MRDAQLLAGADDPDGDLAPVGDQDLGEHALWLRRVAGDRARSTRSPGTRFADVRWVAETGSTNADLLALAGDGAPEGIVLVADHQTAGRGRLGPDVGGAAGRVAAGLGAAAPAGRGRRRLVTMAVGVAVAEAVEDDRPG